GQIRIHLLPCFFVEDGVTAVSAVNISQGLKNMRPGATLGIHVQMQKMLRQLRKRSSLTETIRPFLLWREIFSKRNRRPRELRLIEAEISHRFGKQIDDRIGTRLKPNGSIQA